MIYPQTILTVADNTGAKKILCIRILGGNRKYGKIGDTIVGVIKEAIPNMPIKRSDIVRAVIVSRPIRFRPRRRSARTRHIRPVVRVGAAAERAPHHCWPGPTS